MKTLVGKIQIKREIDKSIEKTDKKFNLRLIESLRKRKKSKGKFTSKKIQQLKLTIDTIH
jgi:hypothetical protein